MNELLPLADLLLMPSELESFGLAALEAMACKVPSIATRVGGVPELIDDGVTGLLYAVGDVEAMAKGAWACLSDRERLEAMREAARKTAQKRFCASLVVPQYVRYYEAGADGDRGLGGTERQVRPEAQACSLLQLEGCGVKPGGRQKVGRAGPRSPGRFSGVVRRRISRRPAAWRPGPEASAAMAMHFSGR